MPRGATASTNSWANRACVWCLNPLMPSISTTGKPLCPAHLLARTTPHQLLAIPACHPGQQPCPALLGPAISYPYQTTDQPDRQGQHMHTIVGDFKVGSDRPSTLQHSPLSCPSAYSSEHHKGWVTVLPVTVATVQLLLGTALAINSRIGR